MLTGVIIGGALIFTTATAAFADDAPVSNLYNNPTLQSIIQQGSQSVQWQQNRNDVRTQLHNALKEHAIVGGIAFIARYENSGYLGQLQQQVQQNTDQITNLIGQLYGSNRQNEFRNLWINHIDLLNQYVDERRSNDGYGLQQTNQQLTNDVNRMADFLTQNNRSQWNNVRQMLQIHVDQEKQIIDTYAAHRQYNNNYNNTYNRNDVSDLINLFIAAANHADMLADQILQAAPTHPSPTTGYMYRVK
jgi:hypothetical protein